jgi:predicted amidophosphoribosyltransferase
MPQSKTIFQHLIDLIYPIEVPNFEDTQGFSFTKDNKGLAVDNIWVANSLDSESIKDTIIKVKDGGQFALVEYLAQHFVMQVIDFGLNTATRKDFEDIESQQLYTMFASLFDPNSPTLITFVPPDPKRLTKRGFHLPELLATEFVKELNIKSQGQKTFQLHPLFIKSQKTQRQTGLDREQRLVNLLGKIELKPLKQGEINSPLLESQSVFIIDDVCTTGATINECALQIKAQFPEIKVYGLAIASNL